MTNDTLNPQTPERVLERPTGDRIIGGVAAALARRLDIGVGWIRTAFIILTFFGGLGLAVYAIGWVTIRGEGETSSIAERTLGSLEGGTAWIGGLMMVIAAMVLVGWFDFMSGELIFAAGLFVAGLLVYQGRFPRPTDPTAPDRSRSGAVPGSAAPQSAASQSAEPGEVAAVVTPDEAGADDDTMARAYAEVEATTHRVDFDTPTPLDGGFYGGEVAAARPPVLVASQPPRPRSILGTLSTAAILITLGVMAFLDRLGIVYSDPEHYLGAVVLIAGVGLLVGAWFGRARGLIVLGMVLAPAAIVASVVDIPTSRDFGEALHRPATISELPVAIDMGGGDLTIDLGDLDPLTVDDHLAVDMGVGQITIMVPDDLDVIVNASVGVGEIETPFGDTSWLGVERTLAMDGSGATLTIDADLGIGQIAIVESAPDRPPRPAPGG